MARNICWFAGMRRKMHAKPRRRIDLYDATAALLPRQVDGSGTKINTCNVESYDLCAAFCKFSISFMNLLRDRHADAAAREIACCAQPHGVKGRQYGVERQVLSLQTCDHFIVDIQPSQRFEMPRSSSRIDIGRTDEFSDGSLAISRDDGGLRSARSNKPAVNDK